MLVAQRASGEELGQPLAERVVQLGDHAGELAVGAVAPVEADRVEDVAEDAELREAEHAVDLGIAGEAAHGLLERQVAVEVVAVAERHGVAPVDGDEPQPPLDLGQLVEVEEPVRDGVAEGVAARLVARRGRACPRRAPTSPARSERRAPRARLR